MTHVAFTTPPTLADIDAIARATLNDFPESMAKMIENIVIMVEDFPDKKTEKEMGIKSPFDLLGLYKGAATGGRMSYYVSHGPDMIFLYRRPLLYYWCEEGDDLSSLVRHVMIHEIGHHFGFSDTDMETLTT